MTSAIVSFEEKLDPNQSSTIQNFLCVQEKYVTID